MIESSSFVDQAQLLHGHRCPAMLLGLRIGSAAMNALHVERATDGQLIALLELGADHCAHCLCDGVQTITGCTYGKGNLRQLDYGKFGLTLLEVGTARAIRVVPRPEALVTAVETSFCKEYRLKGVPPSQVPEEDVAPVNEKILTAPDEALLKLGTVYEHCSSPAQESFDLFVCERCGEVVVERYGRVYHDLRVCIPCQEALIEQGNHDDRGGTGDSRQP